MVLFVTLGWQTLQSYRGLMTTLTADFRLQELRGSIAHLDEVLTMSARMCAATGDMKWEDRYRKYVPQLDVAIKQARDLAPEVFISQAAARTDEANIRLVAMEQRVFEFVRSGNLKQAEALLDSGEYARQKRRYALGMAEVLAGLEQRSETNLRRHRRSLYFTIVLVGVSMPVVVFIWLNVLRITRAGIAEHKRAEQQQRAVDAQIQNAQKLESLGVLAGGIAHDFNNLLMVILGNIDLTLMDIPPESPVRENIAEIKKASQQAADLVKQMLAYSGRGGFVVEPIDLSRIVEDMAQMLKVSVSKKAVLRYNFGDNLPPVNADATQIRQVIMNLITNASDAIGDSSGVISITTGSLQADHAYLEDTYLNEDLPEGLYVMLEVADTGCGMDSETEARIFDPFFTTKFAGRGLGMAAVLGIIRGHKGTISIRSEVGKGTTMRVLLPAVEANPIAFQAPIETGGQWRGSGTVLMVDDEEAVRTIGKIMLERLGMTVILAADGRQAIDVFRERCDEIDCVILDLTMPNMGGEEAFGEIRRIRDDAIVFMSSGHSGQEVTERCGVTDVAGFIQKPYDLAKLATALNGLGVRAGSTSAR